MNWILCVLNISFISFATLATSFAIAEQATQTIEAPELYTHQLKLPYKKSQTIQQVPAQQKSFLEVYDANPFVIATPTPAPEPIRKAITNTNTTLPNQNQAATPTQSAQRIPAQVLDMIEDAKKKTYKFYLYNPGAQTPSLQASAVAIGGSLVFTSFNNISPIINKDPRIRAFIFHLGELIEVQIQAVDVINNLALLTSKKPLPHFFNETEVKTDPLQAGEKFGFLSINKSNGPVSIIESPHIDSFSDGLIQYNKMELPFEKSLYGGAFIDRYGRLAGILRGPHVLDHDRVSAMNTAYFLRYLITQKSDETVFKVEKTKQKIQKQLNYFQDKVTQNLAAIESSATHLKSGNWISSTISRNFSCQNKQINKTPTLGIHINQFSSYLCENKLNINLSDDIKVGHILAQIISITPNNESDLDPKNKFKVSQELAQDSIASFQKTVSNSATFSKSNCQQLKVVNRNAIQVEVHFCTSTFRDYPNLNTTFARLISLNNDKTWSQINLLIEGFDQKNTTLIMRSFTDEIRRTQ